MAVTIYTLYLVISYINFILVARSVCLLPAHVREDVHATRQRRIVNDGLVNAMLNTRTLKIEENLYQKLRFFSIFEAVGPYFLSQDGEIWHEGADLGLPPRSQIL